MRKLLLLFFAGWCAATGTLPAQELLPRPRRAVFGKGTVRCNAVRRDCMPAETGAGARLLFSELFLDSIPEKGCPVLHLSVFSADSPEAYRLRITPDSVVVRAASGEGFLRAAQTLRQLSDGKRLPCCTIEDSPAYAWRGAMLDVSRHFFPLSFLKRQIDALSRFKINRLHLHLTDAAGWRIEIKSRPKLTEQAAGRPQASWKEWWNGRRDYCTRETPGAYGGFYTREELKELVRYASLRGIVIIPEIEMPGHSEEVTAVYPELSCTHRPHGEADFCPGNEATFAFVEEVLQEVMEIFPSEYIHVGGDEAEKKAWPSCPLCQRRKEELDLASTDDLQAWMMRRVGDFLLARGRKMIGWDEITADSLSGNTVVMVWRGEERAAEAVRRGHDVILAPGSHCYLDSYQDAPHTQPEAIGGLLPLERVYSYRPGETLDAAGQRHVLGVQGNLWTEYIATEEHAEYMLYPRMLAIAETGWTGNRKGTYADFRKRAQAATDRLHRELGIRPFDLKKETGPRPESLTPLHHKAVGAKVSYRHTFSPYYPAAAEATLTDGLRGGWNHGDSRWQGFVGKEGLDVLIDLKQRQKISRVEVSFMQSAGAEIFMPAVLTFYTSDDGENFTPIGLFRKEPEKTDRPVYEQRIWKGKSRTRYLRVQALPGKQGGWIFADEIAVF